MMNTTTVKTWRERLGFGPDFPLHAPTDVERAMEAEIADLRAALSSTDLEIRMNDTQNKLSNKLIISLAGAAGMFSHPYSLFAADACLRFARTIECALGATVAVPVSTASDSLVRQALTLAMEICDAIPTRAHDLAEDESLRHLGKLVNCDRGNGKHGFALIRDALESIDQDVDSTETNLAWDEAIELAATTCDYAETPKLAEQIRKLKRMGCCGLAATRKADLAEAQQDAPSQAARDVLAERRRQVEHEEWAHALDDRYQDRQLAAAAACYVVNGLSHKGTVPPKAWPWPWQWWKPTNERRNLVKAGALLLAEIERLDRASDVGAATLETGQEGGAA